MQTHIQTTVIIISGYKLRDLHWGFSTIDLFEQ